MKIKIIKLLFLIQILFLISGCMSSSSMNNVVPEPKNIVVDGDTIYYNNEKYAELRYYYKGLGEIPHYRGLSIYYYTKDIEEWIFPLEGLDITKEHYSTTDKSEGIYDWVLDIQISDNSRYVFYKKFGVFFNPSKKYKIKWE